MKNQKTKKVNTVEEPVSTYGNSNVLYSMKTHTAVSKSHELKLSLPKHIPEGEYEVEVTFTKPNPKTGNTKPQTEWLTKSEFENWINFQKEQFSNIEGEW